MKRITELKISLVLGAVALVTFPPTAVVIVSLIDKGIELVISNAVGTATLFIYLLWLGYLFGKYYKRSEKVNIPVGKKPTGKKSKKWAEFVDIT